MACDYALAILFATGDRNLIVATKTGKLQIFDIAAGRLLEEIAAHEGEAWTVTISPDLQGIAGDGADKSVKFWQFELVVDSSVEKEEEDDDDVQIRGGKRMSLTHTKTLQLEEDVLCVRFSPDFSARFDRENFLCRHAQIFVVTLQSQVPRSLYGHFL